MKRTKVSETKIVQILKEGETGVPIDTVVRKYGIARSTYYKWKSKYGGMELSELKRLKELEAENRRLKQMYADLSLDHRILKDVVEKKLSGQRIERS